MGARTSDTRLERRRSEHKPHQQCDASVHRAVVSTSTYDAFLRQRCSHVVLTDAANIPRRRVQSGIIQSHPPRPHHRRLRPHLKFCIFRYLFFSILHPPSPVDLPVHRSSRSSRPLFDPPPRCELPPPLPPYRCFRHGVNMQFLGVSPTLLRYSPANKTYIF